MNRARDLLRAWSLCTAAEARAIDPLGLALCLAEVTLDGPAVSEDVISEIAADWLRAADAGHTARWDDLPFGQRAELRILRAALRRTGV